MEHRSMGNPWQIEWKNNGKTMETSMGKSMGNPWITKTGKKCFRGTPWVPMGAHGDPWGPMGTHADPWGPMGTHGNPLFLMGAHRPPWAPIGTHGVPQKHVLFPVFIIRGFPMYFPWIFPWIVHGISHGLSMDFPPWIFHPWIIHGFRMNYKMFPWWSPEPLLA